MTSLKTYRIEQSVDINITGIVLAADEESATDIWQSNWQNHVVSIEDLSWDTPWDVVEDTGHWDAGDFIPPSQIAQHTAFGWVDHEQVLVPVTPDQNETMRALLETLSTLGADVVPGVDVKTISTLRDIFG